MRLVVLGSSSSGNCYLLQGEHESLILEAGVTVRDVMRYVKPSEVKGVLISHQHGDHIGKLKEYLKKGIKAYMSAETAINGGYNDPFVNIISKQTSMGGFTVVPFQLLHDVPCVGFLVHHAEMGKLVFVTDTVDCPHRFTGVNHWVVEANYSDTILSKNVADGTIHKARRDRTYNSHMSIDTAIKFMHRQKACHTDNIILCHLSSENSDGEEFKTKVINEFGKPCHIAKKGFKLELI